MRRGDDLREVDDDRPHRAPEHVVRRQVSVDEIAREDAYELRHHVVVRGVRLPDGEIGVDEPPRRVAVGVEHELHQEDAVEVEHGRRHPDVGRVELVQSVGLCRLPGVLGRGLAEARASVDGALRPRVADGAPLLVGRVVLEAARRAVLVDLRRDHVASEPDDVHLGLFAALQASQHLGDDPLGEEVFETASHGPPVMRGRTARRRIHNRLVTASRGITQPCPLPRHPSRA